MTDPLTPGAPFPQAVLTNKFRGLEEDTKCKTDFCKRQGCHMAEGAPSLSLPVSALLGFPMSCPR